MQDGRPRRRVIEKRGGVGTDSWRRAAWTGVILFAGALLLGWPAAAGAQQPAADRRPQATRAELEALWAKLKPEQRTYAEAVALRERLDQGDFQVGDKVIIHVEGDSALSDTFTVNARRGLELPNLSEIPLNGVLRSELADYLKVAVSKYVKSVDLRAQSLMRIAVLGQVSRPGFYNVPAVSLLADVFTVAGGLTANSDLGKAEVRRGGTSFLAKDKVQESITKGLTLDQMNLRSGDEINVGEKKRGGGASAIILIGSIAAALLSVVALVSLLK